MPETMRGAHRELETWLETGPGALILDEEVAISSRLLSNLFGYHLVVVGGRSYLPVIQASRILNASVVLPPGSSTEPASGAAAASGTAALIGEADCLPLASDSVDVVLLPHALEFTNSPHGALREAERVLVGEGHLILTVFNPLGAMGLWKACLRGRRGAPWSGQFFSNTRIKDWLALLGFDVVTTQSAMFRPPIQNQRLLERFRFLDTLGARAWPYLGGIFVILAKKRLTTVTPIRPRWSRRLVSVGIAEPSSRSPVRETAREAESPERGSRPVLVPIEGGGTRSWSRE